MAKHPRRQKGSQRPAKAATQAKAPKSTGYKVQFGPSPERPGSRLKPDGPTGKGRMR